MRVKPDTFSIEIPEVKEIKASKRALRIVLRLLDHEDTPELSMLVMLKGPHCMWHRAVVSNCVGVNLSRSLSKT
jgi:hypothetical protein